jgi:hypothetical protein
MPHAGAHKPDTVNVSGAGAAPDNTSRQRHSKAAYDEGMQTAAAGDGLTAATCSTAQQLLGTGAGTAGGLRSVGCKAELLEALSRRWSLMLPSTASLPTLRSCLCTFGAHSPAPMQSQTGCCGWASASDVEC